VVQAVNENTDPGLSLLPRNETFCCVRWNSSKSQRDTEKPPKFEEPIKFLSRLRHVIITPPHVEA